MKLRFEVKLILIFICAIAISTLITSVLNQQIIQDNFTEFCNLHNKELPSCLRDEAGQTFMKSVEQALLISGGIAVIFSIFLSVVVARVLLKPIRYIIESSKKFASGDYGERINIKTNDEFSELIDETNNLFEKVENIEKFRKDLVANFSHEISTPLTSLYGYIEAFEDKIIGSKKEQKKILSLMKDEVNQVIKLSKETRELALIESENFKMSRAVINLNKLVNEVNESLKPIAESQNIKIIIKNSDKISIRANKDKLKQALTNIVHNAIIYSNSGQTVQISVFKDSNNTFVKIKDNGIGMNPSTMENIFERFYRSDEARTKHAGTGIGLAITKKIIEMHGGSVSTTSSLGNGSSFTVSIPNP